MKANYLASPPLVVAYALAGRMDLDLTTEPLGEGSDGEPVYLRDIWPDAEEIKRGRRRLGRRRDVQAQLRRGLLRRRGMERRRRSRGRPLRLARLDLRAPAELLPGHARRPARGRRRSPAPGSSRVLGDSVTTDHISPAGAIKKDSPAGSWLTEQGVEPGDFNSYGSRRGNHEVMIRGTFANIRLRNKLVEQRRRLHPPLPRRRGDDDLRRRDGLRGRRRAAGGPGGQGVRLRLLARLGGEGDEAARGRRRDRRVLRADPPLEPDRHGRHATAVRRRRERREPRPRVAPRRSRSAISKRGRRRRSPSPRRPTTGETKTFEAKVRLDTPNEVTYINNGGILQTVLPRICKGLTDLTQKPGGRAIGVQRGPREAGGSARPSLHLRAGSQGGMPTRPFPWRDARGTVHS